VRRLWVAQHQHRLLIEQQRIIRSPYNPSDGLL
jgi:hypothetical protein